MSICIEKNENLNNTIHDLEQTIRKDVSKEYSNPSVFRNKLNEITDKMPPVLNAFEKAFINYEKNKQDTEAASILNTSKNSLEKLITQLFMLENNIDKNTEELNINLKLLDEEINILKKENKQLKKTYTQFESAANASDEMIGDFRTIYDIRYLKAWSISISLIIGIYMIITIFKPTTNTVKK